MPGRRLPRDVRLQLDINRLREAARNVVVPKYTGRQKDTKAELDALRSPQAPGAYRLPHAVESISLRTTAWPVAPADYLRRRVWPSLIQHNPHVRCALRLHYDASHVAAANAKLDARLAALRAETASSLEHIAALERKMQRSVQERARKMRVTEAEVQAQEGYASRTPELEAIEETRVRLAAIELDMAALEARRVAVEVIADNDLSDDDVAARPAGDDGAKAASRVQVVGPTTPPDVVAGVREGRSVHWPVTHALEVVYRGRGLVTFDAAQWPTSTSQLLENIRYQRISASDEEPAADVATEPESPAARPELADAMLQAAAQQAGVRDAAPAS